MKERFCINLAAQLVSMIFLNNKNIFFLTMSHLDRELQESRDEQLKFANMAKSLGLLLGIFIVLVLL